MLMPLNRFKADIEMVSHDTLHEWEQFWQQKVDAALTDDERAERARYLLAVRQEYNRRLTN